MDVFDLRAKIGVDTSEYDEGLNDAGSRGKNIASKIGNGIKAGVGIGMAAIGAAATGIAALTKQSIAAYGEQEQLQGGIAKLYEKSTDQMLEYADQAYATTGMSANQYMQGVMGFSASLINSLGGNTEEAARVADMAMRDISDNVNTFGKFTTEEITGVYQALARGQYQTLDNLMLGFAGTKEGMQELIEHANDLAKAQGLSANMTADSYADIVQAIHLVQEEMNITGTTANEAAGTIQGSAGAVKAAWKNLIAGFASPNADLGKLMGNLVSSFIKSVDNIVPAIKRAMSGIGSALAKQAPALINTFIDTLSELGPELIDAATELLNAIITTFSDPETIKKITQAAIDMILSLANGIIQTLPLLIPAIVQTIVTIVETLTNPENLDSLIVAAVDIILAIVDGITSALPILVQSIPVIIKNIIEALTDPGTLSTIISGIVTAITTILESLPEIISILVQAIPEIIEALITALLDPGVITSLVNGAIQLVVELVKHLPEIIWGLICAIPDIIMSILDAFGPIGEGLKNLFSAAWEGIKSVFSGVADWFGEKFTQAKEAIGNAWSNVKGFFANTWDGIKSVFHDTGDWFKEKFTQAKENSVNAWSNAKSLFGGVWDRIKSAFSFKDAVQWGKDMIQNFIDGIKSMFGKVGDACSNVASKVKSFLGFSEPEDGPLANFHTFAPDMMKLFAQGIEDNTDMVQDQMNKSFALPNIDTSFAGTGARPTGGNTITINVYGAEGQDEERLAEIVGGRLMHELNMERMVYA